MAEVFRNGIWQPGTAKPELLPPHLRGLPGNLVSKDLDDPDKAHDLDAPHVINSIVRDAEKAQNPEPEKIDTAPKVAKKLKAPGPGERAPVLQWYVDVAKMRVIHSLIGSAVDACAAGRPYDISVKHLWFPTTNVNEYFLRDGNPPSNKERPKHMRGIDLVVDVLEPPRSIVKALKEHGITLDVMKAIKEATGLRSQRESA
jgi:hypothetical protein